MRDASTGPGYHSVPFSDRRRLAAASAAVCREVSSVHKLTEVDITEVRRLLRAHRERTGERFSLTAYVVTCLARALAGFPELNALRRGRRLYLLDDVTIGILIEHEIEGEKAPEFFAIPAADKKSYREIHEAIRDAQKERERRVGTLSRATWALRLIPDVVIRALLRIASRSPRVARRNGVFVVTSTGMFAPSPMWSVPVNGASISVCVGSIVERPVVVDGRLETREHLCLTLSYDHEITDGAPAVRCLKQFCDLIASGDAARDVDACLETVGAQEGGSDGRA